LPTVARAGAQRQEVLGDAVRGLMASRIADREPPQRRFADPRDRRHFEQWMADRSARLATRLPEARARDDLLRTLDYEAARAGLEAELVLGLIQVESNFRKYAISAAGAMGLMQVMPFWVRLIGDGRERQLFEVRSNLRYGCVILRHYLDIEQGDLFRALGRYNGSLGESAYPGAVLSAWKGDWRLPPGL
jgi:soluble lytic murein transglycosylase-like protein